MHELFRFLSRAILVSSLMFHAANTSVHAGKRLSFSVDLVHRDSPQSPYYKSSAMVHGRSSLYDDKSVGAEVIPNGGDYLVKFSLGTPPVEVTAMVDTGSDLVWLQCAPCWPLCIQQDLPPFDPAQSSTCTTIPCTSQSCNQLGTVIHSCDRDGSCLYTTVYGTLASEVSRGVLSTETISFLSSDGTPSFPSFIFGCGHQQVLGELHGVVGLGAGPLSMVSQLSPYIDYKFSYCLTPASSGVNGKLNFGLDMSRPGLVSIPYTNQASKGSASFYKITLDGITVGNTSIPAPGDEMIIDSGATMTHLESKVYDGVWTALKAAIVLAAVNDGSNTAQPELCYDVSSLAEVNPPDVMFHFRGGDVVLKSENVFRSKDNMICLAMDSTEQIPVLGNIAQVNFEIGFDLKAQTVSFAPADCSGT